MLFDHEGQEMARLYSYVGSSAALSQTRLEAALRLNFGLPHGALAVHEGKLVLTDTFLVAEADDAEVQSSVEFLSDLADRYERLIYGADQH
jgi:hypothetical protein